MDNKMAKDTILPLKAEDLCKKVYLEIQRIGNLDSKDVGQSFVYIGDYNSFNYDFIMMMPVKKGKVHWLISYGNNIMGYSSKSTYVGDIFVKRYDNFKSTDGLNLFFDDGGCNPTSSEMEPCKNFSNSAFVIGMNGNLCFNKRFKVSSDFYELFSDKIPKYIHSCLKPKIDDRLLTDSKWGHFPYIGKVEYKQGIVRTMARDLITVLKRNS